MTLKRSELIWILFRFSIILKTGKFWLILVWIIYNSLSAHQCIVVVFLFIFLSDGGPENKETKRPGQMTNSTQMIKLIIISTGSVITVVLLFFILFTMRIYFTSANVNANSYSFEDVQVDNVYAEIRWWRILLSIVNYIFH